MTELELRAIPACAPDDCFLAATFAEAVYCVKLEVDAIAAGLHPDVPYQRGEIAELRKFALDNRASLLSMSQP